MWDDIICGKGNKECSAVRVEFDADFVEGISENKVSYWLSDCYLDVGMTIFKDSPEGIKVARILKSAESDARRASREMSKFLTGLVFNRLSPTKLKRRVEAFGKSRYEDGIAHCQDTLKEALNL
jgi:hypothetical protein